MLAVKAVPASTALPEGVGFWPVVPVPAPRQVRSDVWKQGTKARPCVARYRAFRDECRWRKVWAPQPGDLLLFLMPIPKSRRRELTGGEPHCQTPDVDNLTKSLIDALHESDAAIWSIAAAKVWSPMGGIVIRRAPPPAEISQLFALIVRQEDPCHATDSF